MKPTDSLGKPSLLGNSNLFSSISIAIADPDVKMAQLQRDILFVLGCKHIYITQDGQEIIDLMRQAPVEIIITEWDMKRMDGQDLTMYLRQSLDSPSRMVPIIVLTANSDREHIQKARDCGVNEYIIKPFSAKSLLERVYAVVEDPRSFVICKNYIGPDRRRISSLSLPPDPDAIVQKKFIERKPAMIVTKDTLKQLIIDDIPRIIMPDYTLKKKVGFDIPEELLRESLPATKNAEEEVSAQEAFVQRVTKDVDRLELAYQRLLLHPENPGKSTEIMKDVTFSIKSRAGVFGYVRATEVAAQLHNFINRYLDLENKNHLIILEKHIQTLTVIFNNRITGDGGETGSELLKDLARLIHKYHGKKH